MNIQIYGKTKCFGTKSAERFFKERKIKFQSIDINEKGMSKRELESVVSQVKDVDLLIDDKSPLYAELNLDKIKGVDVKIQILTENPRVLKTPIVRDCETKKATVGEQISVWKSWIK
ncbi:MAG: ArsC family transcriptional regulator [Clostridia bacterium]